MKCPRPDNVQSQFYETYFTFDVVFRVTRHSAPSPDSIHAANTLELSDTVLGRLFCFFFFSPLDAPTPFLCWTPRLLVFNKMLGGRPVMNEVKKKLTNSKRARIFVAFKNVCVVVPLCVCVCVIMSVSKVLFCFDRHPYVTKLLLMCSYLFLKKKKT